MSPTTAVSATTLADTDDTAKVAPKFNPTPAAVLITEQEVLFGTRVAASAPKASIARRLFDSVRNVASSVHLPPPHEHHPTDMGYLERSRMAREMDRL
jgi:hypothetical protein